MARDEKDESSSAMSTRKHQAELGKAPAKAVVALGGACAESGLVAAMTSGEIAFIGAPRCGHDRRSMRGSVMGLGVQR
jgi:hypothetical protein